MKLKSFKEWSRQDIADEFGLSVKRNCAELKDWIEVQSENDTDTYKSFANRKLSSIIDGKEIGGEVDLMIAGGEFEPKAPYFCLHEYKREKGVDNDPLGQLLIAMLTARALNGDGKVMYGAYVFGRNWFFLTLTGQQYCISNEFVATRDDIYDIFKIMKKLKAIVEERENQQTGEIASDD